MTSRRSAVTLTIITPCRDVRGDYLSQLGTSLRAAFEPLVKSGRVARLVWRIQVDGSQTGVPLPASGAAFPDSPAWETVVCRNGKQCGSAITRNIALGSVDTDLVWSVDEDDVVSGFAGMLVEEFVASSEVMFAVGGPYVPTTLGWTGTWPVTDLVGDGEWAGFAAAAQLDPAGAHRWGFAPPLLPAAIPVGGVRQAMVEHGKFPALGTCAMYRVEALREVGGWPATPTGDDAALLVAVSNRVSGVAVPFPVLAYRQHGDGQNTATGYHLAFREVTYRMVADRL